MSGVAPQFPVLKKQLETELHSLATESKRRNSEVKHASDKSLGILGTVHSQEELLRHPDFVTPLVLACASRNPKLTTIALQCLQGLSSLMCIPEERLSDIIDAFMEANNLAMDIQLKILQVVPIFFKTYARYIHGSLCAKLLKCCSNFLQLPHKSPIVTGTASATLQQLIDEIFDRISYEWTSDADGTTQTDMPELEPKFDVYINGDEKIKVNCFRYDANGLFRALFASIDIRQGAVGVTEGEEPLFEVRDIPMDYGLEIFESILKNNIDLFLKYEDLQYLLKIMAIPTTLRCISNSKNFSTVVRSCRCIKILLRVECMPMLELELEVILSVLVRNLAISSNLPYWYGVLTLEIFNDISRDFGMIMAIYAAYDNFPDKKHVITNILTECHNLLQSREYIAYLGESPVVEKFDMPTISNEESMVRTKYIHLLDKVQPPSANPTYIIWLILSLINSWSEKLSTTALDIVHSGGDSSGIIAFYNGVFGELFQVHKLFLYSTALDSHLFHALVRGFQKLAHGAGVLSLLENLDKCLELFSYAIVNNIEVISPSSDDGKHIRSQSNSSFRDSFSSPVGVLSTLGETLIGVSRPQRALILEPTEKEQLHPRIFNSRQLSLVRALISLSVSLGPIFNSSHWRYIFVTWQWVSYYIYGPSVDFMESFYMEDIPAAPDISKSDISAVENQILKLFENTMTYPTASLATLLKTLINESQNSIFVDRGTCKYHPVLDHSNTIANCIYNKGFYTTEIGDILITNYSRFLSSPKGKEIWDTSMKYFVDLIASRNISNTSLRLYIVRIFTDVIKGTTEEVSNIEDQDQRERYFQSLEDLIMFALIDTIEALGKLTVTIAEIYQGVVNTEAEILLQILSTLKGILNEFGDILTHSWHNVFRIINSPFGLFRENIDSLDVGDADDSSLINGCIQKYAEMIQVSDDVFKLISDDFLQVIPLDTTRLVIDTLVNFVSQDKNLNISLSSISQFWLVGDYLRSRNKPENNIPTDQVGVFRDQIFDGKLVSILETKESKSYEIYEGLWIYLLKKLIECTRDERIEVKNGSIQTFFRIVDSHSNCLPPWDILFNEVLRPLLNEGETPENQVKYIEFYDITLHGLISLYPANFNDFSNTDSHTDAWLLLLDYLQNLISSDSTVVNFVAINNFRELLKVMSGLDGIPSVVLEKVHQIWINYNVVYSDPQKSENYPNKTGYECVLEFISAYPHVYALMEKYNSVTYEFVESSLGIFNTASKYPLLPEHIQDKTKPTSLQQTILDGLSIFGVKQNKDIELLILFQLSTICKLPFDTRRKIEVKLGPRLNDSAKSRIPTFEAVSYRASQILLEHLEATEGNSITLDKGKYVLKMLKNLADIVETKSTIDVSPDKTSSLWVQSSKSFRKLSLLIFKSCKEMQVSQAFTESFHRLFIQTMVNSIRRLDNEKDLLTETNDIEEYLSYRDILFQNVKAIDRAHLSQLVSTIWSGSFLYNLDDVEDALIASGNSLVEVTKKISELELSELSGSTSQPPLKTKLHSGMVCLEDLVRFTKQPGDDFTCLRDITIPYFVSRTALVLRRFILDGSLLNRAPVPKLRKLELLALIKGMNEIMNSTPSGGSKSEDTTLFNEMLVLQSLILKAIPLSHKIEGLQKEIACLSLSLGKLR